MNFKVPFPKLTKLSTLKSSTITAIYVLSSFVSKVSSAACSVINHVAISSFNVSKSVPSGTIITTGTESRRGSVSVPNNLAPGYPGVFKNYVLEVPMLAGSILF